jgi:TRAP-type C4-dicarboxylate transport system substrate-binding protein
MKTPRSRALLFVVAALALHGTALAAGPEIVKLATLAPDGSVWHKVLKDLELNWSRETQGRVALRIYPGGVAGSEPDMVRKMRIGQLHAAAITAGGLTSIDEAFEIFGIPMFFESYQELFYVLERMEPVLKKRLEAKGFVLLNWGHGGWAHFFTRQPVQSVADMKKLRIYVSAGDDRMVQLWKQNGFQPVALAETDIMTGLQTGMIDALPTPPLAALYLQWFRSTPYMVHGGLGPLVGGLVVTRRAWDRISEPDRARLLTACRKAERRLATGIPGQDTSAVRQMEQRGLKVVHLKPESEAEWRTAAESFAMKMRGSMVPGDVLDLATRERDAFRRLSGRSQR